MSEHDSWQMEEWLSECLQVGNFQLHDNVDDMDVGKHPFVARLLLKGTFIQDCHFFLIFRTLGSSCGAKYYAAMG